MRGRGRRKAEERRLETRREKRDGRRGAGDGRQGTGDGGQETEDGRRELFREIPIKSLQKNFEPFCQNLAKHVFKHLIGGWNA